MKRFAAVLIAALCVLVPVSASIDPAVAGLLGYPVTFSGYPALSGDELYGEDVLPIALGALISGTDIHFQDFISGDEDTIAAALLDLILLEAETGNFEVYASRGLIIPSITDSRGRIGYDISYIDFSFAYSTDEKAGSFEIDGNVYGWVDSSDEILLSIAVGTDGIRIGDEAYDASEFRIDIFFDKAVADDFFGNAVAQRNVRTLRTAVDVGRIEEVDAGFIRGIHDFEGGLLIGRVAEIHRSEAQAANEKPRAAKLFVLHNKLP